MCTQLDAIDSSWQRKIFCISREGEQAMTGRVPGVQTRLQQTVVFPLMHGWYGLHRLDLVTEKKYSLLSDDMVATNLTDLFTYIQSQQNLTAQTKTACPILVSSRWF